jgi:hypothetical protein
LLGLFTGVHAFSFEDSKITPGGTTFVQSEEFSGPLWFIMNPAFGLSVKSKKGFEAFNEELKKKAESLA